jgi:hypothetical protein
VFTPLIGWHCKLRPNTEGEVGILHRDLAARNVLIDEKLHVKVADFVRLLSFKTVDCALKMALRIINACSGLKPA